MMKKSIVIMFQRVSWRFYAVLILIVALISGGTVLFFRPGHLLFDDIPESDGYLSQSTVLPGVTNLSSLTFNRDDGMLYATLNSPPTLLRLSRDGDITGSQPLDFLRDAESVEYIADGQYALADEANSLIYIVSIDADMAVTILKKFHAGMFFSKKKNRGYEGLAWDGQNNRLYLGREKGSERLYSLEYHPDTQIISGVNVHHGLNQRLHLQDISGLDFDGNNLLILSDESGVLLRTQPGAEQDAVISVMHLKKGCHGLEQDIPQPEGVATDDEGNIYVVSEPDGFWKFTAVKNVIRAEE
ncbi:SdiA-regulated domain-containing protein [Escherichia sp. 0.2392]|uniref:SdiA-regulated domain-containing protein n=1 Tax=Escherichia sp. 0.2392 TaxID=2730946 RepID=UPI0016043E35|nr:SdiA-regulated domain-containing protein [Escherichia sp. 0.2392]MBB2255079.1 SdiA-regulated domain-containing protein [Escherichia sp. 0.2392]